MTPPLEISGRAARSRRRNYRALNDGRDEEEDLRVTKSARKDKTISQPLKVGETSKPTLVPPTNKANTNTSVFNSNQPIPGTEDRSPQSERLSSSAPISQQTQLSTSSFSHEELTPFLGRSESQLFDSSDSTSSEAGNSFSEQFNENDGQANIADATISEDVEGTIISVGERSHEEENMGEPDRRSWIWTHFSAIAMPGKMWTPRGYSKPRENREIRCIWPSCSFSTTDEKRHGSTSNMLRHFNTRHQIAGEDQSLAEKHTQAMKVVKSVTHSIEKKPRAPTRLSAIEVLEQNVIKWIITTTQPFTVIEDPAFQQIFHDLPGVFLPLTSARTVSRRVMDHFDTYRSQLEEELATTCKAVAISLDIWTNETEIPILAIIGHWLTPGFDYLEKVFDFKQLEVSYTGDNLAEAVYNCLNELGVKRKLLTITADGASNNVAMTSVLHQRLLDKAPLTPTNKLRFEGVSSLVRCLAYIIDLIVKTILKNLKADTISNAEAICDSMKGGTINDEVRSSSFPVIQKVRVLAIWISRHSGRKQAWKRICQLNNSPEEYIPYDVPTDWNSTYYMLKGALKAQTQATEYIRINSEISFLHLTHTDYTTLREIVRVLSLFEEFTRVVSSSRPQISFSLGVYWELFDLLQEVSDKEGNFSDCQDVIVEATKAGMLKFQKYYSFMDKSNTYYTAAILDPRFKHTLLKKKLDKEDYELIVGDIRSRLRAQYGHLSTINRELTPESTKNKADSSLNMTCSIESHMSQAIKQNNSQTSDIDRYFDSDVIEQIDGAGTDENWLLNWWCHHTAEYPCMAAAARDFLAIPASKVAVERLFNGGRDALGSGSQAMSVETLRVLMLAKEMEKSDQKWFCEE